MSVDTQTVLREARVAGIDPYTALANALFGGSPKDFDEARRQRQYVKQHLWLTNYAATPTTMQALGVTPKGA